MRTLTAALILTLITSATCARAETLRYRLEADKSDVGFEVNWGEGVISGRMPVASADLALDFDKVAASRVRVEIEPARASANVPFAREAMVGASVLDTANHPLIRFESTAVRARGDGAEVQGNVTIRGVTRPVTLAAMIYRPQGSEPGARDRLSILLTGSVSRSAFGAAGWAGTVGDEVRLRILARIARIE